VDESRAEFTRRGQPFNPIPGFGPHFMISGFRRSAQGAAALLALALLLALAGCGAGSAVLSSEVDEPLYRAGQQRQREGNKQEALADFLRVIIKRSDQAPESHLEAGLIYQDYDPIAAIYHFKKYLELEPNSREVANVRGLIDTAKRNFARTLPLAPTGLEGLAGQSDLLEQINRLQRENDEYKAQLVSLRGEVPGFVTTPAAPGAVAATAAPIAAGPVPVAAPEETAPVVAPVEPAAAPPPPVAAPRPHPAPERGPRSEHGHSYTVQAHDTLYKIAKKVYGSATAANVHAIQEANRGVLTSSGALRPGMELKVP
jgi:phage tail protein X